MKNNISLIVRHKEEEEKEREYYHKLSSGN